MTKLKKRLASSMKILGKSTKYSITKDQTDYIVVRLLIAFAMLGLIVWLSSAILETAIVVGMKIGDHL